MLISHRFTTIRCELTTLHSDIPYFVVDYSNPADPLACFTTVLTHLEAKQLHAALEEAIAYRECFPNDATVRQMTPKPKGSPHGDPHRPDRPTPPTP